ncbi:MAG TPA: tetratricopeptide repeat protein [Candidatus Polarisedimenticolaceae bacterium]|nr:tetratricopeptide repeat protein [Candidatus Polarisedimenticolaceae bacterium]
MHPAWKSARSARSGPWAALHACAVTAACAGWGALCFSAYRAHRAPVPADTDRSVLTRPFPEDFREAADRHVLAAVRILQDASLPATERIDRYSREAAGARDLYTASLQGRAYQPLTVARLAALRFEEYPPLTDDAWQDWALTLDLAGGMAPRNASVQAALGELLVRMGRPQEGLAAYARALSLDPSLARRVVPVLGTFGIAPERAMAALPRTAPLLLAMRQLYGAERQSDYADLLEPDLATASPELLVAWADARLASKQADRVCLRLEALPPFTPPDREAARCVQISRAQMALGNAPSAVSWAARARTASPRDPRALEQSAHAALAGGDPDAALRFCREALTLFARSGGSSTSRARIYELSARAEERRGHLDAAHDAYTRALALDPNRRTSRQRLEAMRAAAGLTVPSPPQ